MSGWIKLHRSMLGHFVASDPEYLSVWIHILMLANHSDSTKIFNGKPVTVRRGQLITSRDSLSSKTGVNSSKVHRVLKMLEIEQQIEQQTSNKYRLISVTNYGSYQASEQQANNRRTTGEQQANTLEECNNNGKNGEEGPPTPKGAIGIKKYLDKCKQDGVPPIPAGDPVFKYASESEIPEDYLRLCWLEFVERSIDSGKRYKDWKSAFRKCVRGNWYKIWWVQTDGSVVLSSNGNQAATKHKDKL